jgi:hypothetical protein
MKLPSASSAASFAVVLSLQLTGCAPEEALEADDLESSTSSLVSRNTELAADGALVKGGTTKTATSARTLGTSIPISIPSQPLTIASTVGNELQANHPWVVDISGTGGLNCRGVLIHPLWVLTAAHCIGPYAGTVSYTRSDPASGAVAHDSRSMNVNGPQRGMFKHPQYQFDTGFGQPANDIALIRLAQPFNIDRNIQTAALPGFFANPGRVGAIVTHDHGGTPPTGYATVLRSPQVSQCTAPSGFLCVNPPAGSVCEGDSGSAFVEVLDGRAQVVGIASNMSSDGSSCIPAGGQLQLADVFSYRDWIYGTMGMGAEETKGRVRLRWAGSASPSIMSLQCLSADLPAIEVPMNVPGGEIAMNCDDARVFCQAQGANTSLNGFSLRTIANGTSSVQPLTFTSGWTAAFGDPGSAFLEFTCSISKFGVTLPVSTGGVLTAAF